MQYYIQNLNLKMTKNRKDKNISNIKKITIIEEIKIIINKITIL